MERAKLDDESMRFIDHEKQNLVYLDMLEEAKVKVQLYTFASDAIVEDNTIKGIITESKSGRAAIIWNNNQISC